MVSQRLYFVLPLIFLLGSTSVLRAQTPVCNKLKRDQRAIAREILRSRHPYDCCDETIMTCLKKRPRCRLAVRLADDVCRRVARGEMPDEIERAISLRAMSLMPWGKPVEMDLSLAPAAGEADAPVVMVEYACASCPLCSKLTPKLYREVTEGTLRGKVRLHLRPFPIRGHEGSTEGGLAMVAAAKLGKFWPFLLTLYGDFDHLTPEKLPEWATSTGMDKASFEKTMNDEETKKLLVESKKEGLRNNVKATPTIFINGKKYLGDLNIDTLIDVLGEKYDRLTGRQYEEKTD